MPDNIRQFEPILPYPSRQSLIDFTLAAIERSASIDRPSDWEEYEPIYLKEEDVIRSALFNQVVSQVINGAEPAPWLLRDLKEFEQMLVEDILASLEDNPEGRAFLEVMRSYAVSQEQAWSNRE